MIRLKEDVSLYHGYLLRAELADPQNPLSYQDVNNLGSTMINPIVMPLLVPEPGSNFIGCVMVCYIALNLLRKLLKGSVCFFAEPIFQYLWGMAGYTVPISLATPFFVGCIMLYSFSGGECPHVAWQFPRVPFVPMLDSF